MPNPVLTSLIEQRDHQFEIADEIAQRALTEERDLTESEVELVTRNRERVERLNGQITPLQEMENLQIAAGTTRATLVRSVPVPTPAGNPQNPQAPVYATYAQWARDEMIRRFDGISALVPGGRAAAEERLTRAVVNTLSGDVPGLIPTPHMSQILQVIDKSRPFVAASRRVNLDAGKLTYPWITSRPAVSVQAAEKTETPGNKMAVQMNTVTAKTYLGSGDLSWQTITWSTPDALALWFDLAAEAYAQATEQETAGNIAGTTGTTTVASDTFADWYAALAEAAGKVFVATRAVADTIYADVETGFKLAGMVSTSMPVFNAAGSINLSTGQGSVGGLRLVVSPMAAPPLVVVGSSRFLITGENTGAPVELRAVEPNIGGMEVGVIGAFAASIVDEAAFEKITPPVVGAAANGGTRTAAK